MKSTTQHQTHKVIEEDLQKIKSSLMNFTKDIEGKTFLVTGGAGFLGSWLCDTLNTFNAKIICVDNFSSGSKENIKHLIEKENFILLDKNVVDIYPEDFEKIDYIVHMSSIASPLLYQENPIETLDANILGTKKILQLAQSKKVKAVLFTSTSEVYGDAPDDKVPTKETYYGNVNSYGPRSMYDEGKRAAEAYCYSFWKKSGTPIRIVRIFNTYGPRLDIKSTNQYGRALVKFISQALGNQPITIYGDGKQTRSFCYITDQIIGLLKLTLTPNIDGEIINIGNNQEITILTLAEKIKSSTNTKSQIAFGPFPKDDPKRRCPDLEKASRLLGYKPNVSLDEGLRRTIEWVRTQEAV
jgi:UDP-glucuronate decarboxylase